MTALRARWRSAALLVALYALPILGITAYFTLEEMRGLANAQNEHAGLRQIAAMDAALFDLWNLAQYSDCAGGGAHQQSSADSRVDRDMSAPKANGPFAVDEWNQARVQWLQLRNHANSGLDRVMPYIGAAVAKISDRSGLTFDAQIGAVDLSDALTYRLPQAISSLARVRREVCAVSAAPSLPVRLEIVATNAQARTLLDDAFFDVNDAGENGGIDSVLLEGLNGRVQARVANSSAALSQFALRGGEQSRRSALASLAASISGLNRLMEIEIPQIDATIDSHITDHRRRMALAIAEGLAALLAAAVIAFLFARLIYQYAALSAAQRMAAESEHRATHDPLTGLLNRRAFLEDRTNHGILCVVDVDDLKKINDTFGHSTGDRVLEHIANILQKAVRASDPVARLGGDEFAVFLRTPVEGDAVDRILDNVFHAMRAPFAVNGRSVRLSVSVGTATVDSSVTLEEAFARADEALYRAKRQARGGAMHTGFRCADA